jgi:hypothetical protein
VTLKLVINYGVDGGSIVVVGPASCFGSGDINKGTTPKSSAVGAMNGPGRSTDLALNAVRANRVRAVRAPIRPGPTAPVHRYGPAAHKREVHAPTWRLMCDARLHAIRTHSSKRKHSRKRQLTH